MSEQRPEPTSDAPFGTEPRRALWPLAALIVLFVVWCALLLWLTIAYPAR